MLRLISLRSLLGSSLFSASSASICVLHFCASSKGTDRSFTSNSPEQCICGTAQRLGLIGIAAMLPVAVALSLRCTRRQSAMRPTHPLSPNGGATTRLARPVLRLAERRIGEQARQSALGVAPRFLLPPGGSGHAGEAPSLP